MTSGTSGQEEGLVDIYSMDGFVSTYYDTVNNIIRAKWYNYGSSTYLRTSLQIQLKVIEEKNARAIVVDSSEARGLPKPEDDVWFERNVYPELSRLKVKLVVFIHTKNHIAQLAVKNWQVLGKKYGLHFIEVYTLDEAMEAVNKYA